MNAVALIALAERCEAASEADRILDAEIAIAAGVAPVGAEHEGNCSGWVKAPNIQFGVWKSPEFTTSLDAAMSLVPEGYDGQVQFGTQPGAWLGPPDRVEADDFNAAATPALALCATALRARASVEGNRP